MALPFLSVSKLLARYRARTLSPVEATSAACERIERLEPKINAFCHRAPREEVLAAARASEARWRESGVTSELSGGKLVASALALPAGGQGRKSPVYGNTERQCGQSSLSRG